MICTGDIPNCIPGSGSGIGISAFGVTGFRVRNGHIDGMGNHGINGSGFNWHISAVSIRNCLANGMSAFAIGGILETVNIQDNGQMGAAFGNAGTVVRNSVFVNKGSFGVNDGFCSGNLFVSNGDSDGTAEENCDARFDVNICGGSPCP